MFNIAVSAGFMRLNNYGADHAEQPSHAVGIDPLEFQSCQITKQGKTTSQISLHITITFNYHIGFFAVEG